jgi:steroid delta-isomerase
MFDNVDNPKFKVKDFSWSQRSPRENVAYLSWDFTATSKGKEIYIPGMSEVTFSLNYKVMEHIDYWDAATYFYEKLPIIGMAIRWIKAKLAV